MGCKSRFLVLLLSFITGSCCYNGIYSEGGLPRKKIRPFHDKNFGEFIDTLAVYKTEINFALNQQTGQYVYFEKHDDNSYPYVSYLKFYKGNKLGLFVISKSDTLKLTRAHFNPINAKMGYYSIAGTNLRAKIATIGDCALRISTSKGTMRTDSLVLVNRSGHGNIYVKQRVPKEYLENWKPDW